MGIAIYLSHQSHKILENIRTEVNELNTNKQSEAALEAKTLLENFYEELKREGSVSDAGKEFFRSAISRINNMDGLKLKMLKAKLDRHLSNNFLRKSETLKDTKDTIDLLDKSIFKL